MGVFFNWGKGEWVVLQFTAAVLAYVVEAVELVCDSRDGGRDDGAVECDEED